MINDMMTNFELYQPSSVEDALALLDRHNKDGWKLAGGNDSLDWFKDRITCAFINIPKSFKIPVCKSGLFFHIFCAFACKGLGCAVLDESRTFNFHNGSDYSISGMVGQGYKK